MATDVALGFACRELLNKGATPPCISPTSEETLCTLSPVLRLVQCFLRSPTLASVLLGAAVAFGLIAASPLQAQQYPTRAVRVVVPFPPGSGIDTITRLYTNRLPELMGQQFIVDNRSGAAGNVGAELVVRSAPDGYTLLSAASSAAISQSLYKNLSFDLIRDFDPVAMFAAGPFLLVTNVTVPATNLKELIALAKASPGKLTFASTGTGSSPHLTGEMLKMQAGLSLLHVPYKGVPQAVADMVGGRVDLFFASTVSLLPHVKTGKLRAIAMASDKRSAAAPDLPTFAEAGMPGFESSTWWSLIAPSKTPRDAIVRLNSAILKIAQTQEIRERMAVEGSDTLAYSPEQTGAFIKSEMTKWAKVVVASGATAD